MLRGFSKSKSHERSYGRPTPSDQDEPLPVKPAPIVQATSFGADTMAGDGSGGGSGSTGRGQSKLPWRPGVAVLYALLLFIVAQFVAALVMLLYPTVRGWSVERAEDWLNTSVPAQFWYVLIAEALTFGGIWWFIRRRGAGLPVIGWKRPRWVDPAYALGGFVVYFLALIVVTALVTALIPSLDTNQKQELGFDNVVSNIDLVLTFASLVILPPIVEEVVFRGFIFTSLRGGASGKGNARRYRRGRVILAALVTSALFAVAHLQFGNGQPLLWIAAVDTFVLSLVLCYLRQKTDSLASPILLHAIKNSIAFVALFVIGVQ